MSKTTTPKPAKKPDRRKQALAAVRKAGAVGITSAEFAKAIGVTKDRASGILSAAAKDGSIGCDGLGGNGVRWFSASFVAEKREERRIKSTGRDEAYLLRAARAAEKKAREAADDQWTTEWAEKHPTRRVVPAALAAPLQVTAANSVFNLAVA